MDTATAVEEECAESQPVAAGLLLIQDNSIDEPTSQNPKPKAVIVASVDLHPFARGSVIEVLCRHHKETADEDMEEDWEEEKQQQQHSKDPYEGAEVRLADIIDRAPFNTPNHVDPAHRWKYYVHYRDFNRRMDEWVTNCGAPSVGNAKVRIFMMKNVQLHRSLRKSQSCALY